MFQFLFYYISYVRLSYFSGRKKINRYNFCSPNASIEDFQRTGAFENDEAWKADSPSLEKSENLIITTSNTFDKSALKLIIKWRPNKE